MENTKIPVAVLGATGAVGQRFVQLLASHPWFELQALLASERSAGQRYADVCRWIIPGDPPPDVGKIPVISFSSFFSSSSSEPSLPVQVVFSALPSDVAREVEPRFARAGYVVCSNASAFRYDPDVPLLIPEVNADHVALVERQRNRYGSGFIVTSPNCTTTGLVFPLKPLDDAFGVRKVFAVTMQAVSGAGHPGVSSLDILGNIVPYIRGEEEKIEQETRLLLGRIVDGQRIEANVVISAQANRVPVLDGHTVCMSLAFERRPTVEEALAALNDFRPQPIIQELPSAPERPLLVRTEPDRPQPRRDRDAEAGMAVSVGRVRSCPLLDLRMLSVVHNTLRGAASGSILNAELLVAQGYVER